jgi:hypothetical protein
MVVDKEEEDKLKGKITHLMHYLESRCNKNELILNIRTSCARSFHPRQGKRVCKPSIVYSNLEIPYKLDVKFLGIKFAENLGWNIRINSIRSNLNKASCI